MQLKQIVQHLDAIAPPHLAEPWDNVGLLVGNPTAIVHRVLFTIDYTLAVADEARSLGCELIVAYHPPIFKDLKRLVEPNLIHDAIARGVAIYSPHTALDVADGGTNDFLADALGMTAERQPLRSRSQTNPFFKLVVFVPSDHLENVREALFLAGAGQFNYYDRCSFGVAGIGTFRGDPQTHPAIGEPGKFVQVDEVRLEMLAPRNRIDTILSTLRRSHPYEEPAFDLFALENPSTSIGVGRIGPVDPTSRTDLIHRLKRELKLDHLLVAGSMNGVVHRAACCAGSSGELLDDALTQKAALFLTGELRHHDALRAAAAGMTVVCTLHSNSERGVLSRLIQRLLAVAPALSLEQSRRDRDPFSIQ